MSYPRRRRKEEGGEGVSEGDMRAVGPGVWGGGGGKGGECEDSLLG